MDAELQRNPGFEHPEALPSSTLESIFEMLRQAGHSIQYGPMDFSKLPFNVALLENRGKIGEGGESEVYLLESRQDNKPSYVVKITHTFYDSDSSALAEAEEIKEDYGRVKEIYAEIPGLIPKEHLVILENPNIASRHKSTVGVVQRFYGHNIHDFFEGFSVNEVLAQASRDSRLADKIRKFAQITLKHDEAEQEMVDVFGEKNLCLVKKGNSFDLILLDPHVIYATDPDSLAEEKLTELYSRVISYLREVLEGLDRLSAKRAA